MTKLIDAPDARERDPRVEAVAKVLAVNSKPWHSFDLLHKSLQFHYLEVARIALAAADRAIIPTDGALSREALV